MRKSESPPKEFSGSRPAHGARWRVHTHSDLYRAGRQNVAREQPLLGQGSSSPMRPENDRDSRRRRGRVPSQATGDAEHWTKEKSVHSFVFAVPCLNSRVGMSI